MRRIKLTQGKYAIVDDGKYETFNSFNWNYSYGYAARSIYKRGEYPYRSFKVYMHHCVIGQPLNRKFEIDHINGDRLDNRSENLRIVNRRTNTQNKIKNRNGKLAGVRMNETITPSWRATIGVNGKSIHLGVFDNPQKAHRAYLEACKKYEC